MSLRNALKVAVATVCLAPVVGCEGMDGEAPNGGQVTESAQAAVGGRTFKTKGTFTSTLSVTQGPWHHFGPFVVNGGHFEATMTPINTDQDIYLLKGQRPNQYNWDCRPYRGAGGVETCAVDGYTGNVYVSVQGYEAGQYTIAISGAQSQTLERLVYNDESVDVGNWNYYGPFDVGIAGWTQVAMTPSSADPDLYTNHAQFPPGTTQLWPSTGQYRCRPYLGGTTPEICDIYSTDAYVGVRGYSGAPKFKLQIEAQ